MRVPPEPLPPLGPAALAVPAVAEVVSRPRLHARLDAGAPVTLVAAPAGWGKTVLVASWARSVEAPVAWLALELDDGTDRLGQAVRSLPPGGVLVIDDLHHVSDPAFLTELERLVRHATGRFRLVLASRVAPALPLSRWRIAGDLVELGPADLACTLDEAAALLGSHPRELVEHWHRETEGWPAMLRLIAIHGAASPPGIGILAGNPEIAEYVRREVLLAQPPELRETLLRSAVPDRISGGLLDALTGRGDGERALAELRRRTLFMEDGAFPRYHRLLVTALRDDLRRRPNGELATLHRRTAQWYERAGRPGDALPHALAANDEGLAWDLVTRHWPRLLLGCGTSNVGSSAGILGSDAADEGSHPRATLVRAAAHVEGGRFDRAARELAPAADPPGDGNATTVHIGLQLAMAHHDGDAEAVAAAAESLLRGAERGESGPAPVDAVRASALTALGLARLEQGDLPVAGRSLVEALVCTERLGQPCAHARAASALALVRATEGHLTAAEHLVRDALTAGPCPGRGTSVHCGLAFVALAVVHLERDHLEQAEAALHPAVGGPQPAADPMLAAFVAILEAQAAHERNDPATAYTAMLAGRNHVLDRPSPLLREWYASVEARIRIAHADVEAVRAALTSTSDGQAPAVAVALAQGYLAADDSTAACRALPDWAGDGWAPDGHGGDGASRSVRLEAGLVRAVAAQRGGDERTARRALERLLAAAEPEGFRRPFVRGGRPVRDLLEHHLDSGTAYWGTVRELIGAFDGVAPPPRIAVDAGLAEPLTEREITVLRYLQSVLSTAEIAADLSVSVNTVKTHLRNIYRKLDTARRGDAVRKARQLHLI
jgi:LuxR family transcriptional regulator, maltose regulon positive regulatory protein